ncbi:MAG: UDP-N-acetylmuramoyl-tripeptide--D-alanyl-D-alanine ligase [Eubacteriales bacterium]|nr:UDP-N-acetylmuramoyl-tripeptide--D-alanyl-D-alanine ligase [Eubacteriales bacterium]MDD4389894.1 UDP-N-acetylmuramoyl-tripeptide--D-alanyl-D-alanine ligase [Eubacteriales bacterium]
MKKTTIGNIKDILGAELIAGDKENYISGISIDSRQTQSSDIFFAIIGENHDAHDFLDDVFNAGCKAAVVSDREAALAAVKGRDVCVLLVDNTVKALQSLAKEYLPRFDIKKFAVTGSVGKTSTRDMLAAVMATRYKTVKPEKNYNNEIGLPLTAFLINEDTKAAVFEMGMEREGEIRLLADIVRPHVAVITNVGSAHIETAGSRGAILRAKLEIAEFLTPDDYLVIYEDGDLLKKASAKGNYHIISVGKDGNSDFILSDICNLGEKGVEFTIEHNYKTQRIKLPVPGEHNAYNAALAIAAASCFGVEPDEAAKGLAGMKITDKRLSIKGNHGIKVIDDTYNASPDSMKAGILTLMSIAGLRRVAILGDMFGLGEQSEKYHREVGEFVGESNLDLLITIGSYAQYINEGSLKGMKDRTKHFNTKGDFIKEIDKIIQKGDVILVKGSRGMKMEQIVKKILE